MKNSKWHKADVGLFSVLLVFSATPAQAAVPQAPGFAKVVAAEYAATP